MFFVFLHHQQKAASTLSVQGNYATGHDINQRITILSSLVRGTPSDSEPGFSFRCSRDGADTLDNVMQQKSCLCLIALYKRLLSIPTCPIPVDSNIAVQHTNYLSTVCLPDMNEIALVRLGNRKTSSGMYSFTCNCINCTTNGCGHRACVNQNFDIDFGGEQSSNPVTVRIPLEFNAVQQDFASSRPEKFMNLTRDIELFIPMEMESQSALLTDVLFQTDRPIAWYEWTVANAKGQISHVSIATMEHKCNPPSFVFCQYLIVSEIGVSLVNLEVCKACGKTTVDSDHDLFLCAAPSHGKIGFGITISLARSFVQTLLKAVNINTLFLHAKLRLFELFKTHMQLLQQIENSSCLTYERFQHTIYACLASSGILKLLKSTRCPCSMTSEIIVIVDGVFLGPTYLADYIKE